MLPSRTVAALPLKTRCGVMEHSPTHLLMPLQGTRTQ